MLRSLLVFVLMLAISSPPYAQEKTAVKNDPKETLKLLELFGDVFEKVRNEYVEEPDDQKLVEAAINGMLTDLDPHSSYLSKRDYEEMQVQTRGEFGGLGIEVTMENGLVKVVSPIDDTPAFQAGIKAGDYISHIDEESVMGLTLSAAVDKMRGKPGTKIKLTVLRENESEPLDFTIMRDVIKIKSVRSERYGDVAYIRVTSFSEKTAVSVETALEKEKKAIGADKLLGMVLDLRNNPGGLLDQAIAVSDLFMDKGEVVSTRGRLPDSTKRYNATSGDILEGKPIVVLINAGSASASEIVAGALQDHKRAVVIGAKSFGKGSVQTIIPLPRDGAMRLTTSRYYTPSGTSIQAEGIVPDIKVDHAELQFTNNARKHSEASLRGHLDNGKPKPEAKPAETQTPDAKGGAEVDESRALYEKDYQLGRAIDLLRALSLYAKER